MIWLLINSFYIFAFSYLVASSIGIDFSIRYKIDFERFLSIWILAYSGKPHVAREMGN